MHAVGSSRERRTARLAVVALLASVRAGLDAAGAHEKWFYDAGPYPTRWIEAVRFPGVVGVGVALASTLAAWLVWRARRGRDLLPGPEALGATEAGRARFYAFVPLILGIHVGMPLIVLGIRGELFAPANALHGPAYYAMGVVEIGVGVSLLYGGMTRLASVALAGLWVVGTGVVGLEPMLENVHFLGFAAFFFLAGRGPYAIDRALFPRLEPSRRLARHAMLVARFAIGASLAVVAFTEKLANPALAAAFLRAYPLNFTRWLGAPMSDELFALCGGVVELSIGLWLMLGLFPRVIIVTAWALINVTLTVFTWTELLGHLPIYGMMAILLVWTPSAEDGRRWERGVLGKLNSKDGG